MARRLRPEHRAALVGAGFDPHRELRAAFDASCETHAWLIDGKLAALGGVTGTALSAAAEIWLVVAQLALDYPHHVVREARRQLARIAATRNDITTTALLNDKPALRLMWLLGFEPALPFNGIDKKICVMRYAPQARRIAA